MRDSRLVINEVGGGGSAIARWVNFDRTFDFTMLKLRAEQAKEDWLEEKSRYKEKKKELQTLAEEKGMMNKHRKEVERIVTDHRKTYEKGRKKHQEKIRFLKEKHRLTLRTLDEEDARKK